MHEILRHLSGAARVLDIGSRHGSFPDGQYPVIAIRADLEANQQRAPANFVQADAAQLPFAAGVFDAVISNHSLEHFADLNRSLREIGRVLKSDGSFYAAVPDSSTVTDRIYRWLARGGGHLNAFFSANDVVAQIQTVTGLKHTATRVLCTSLSFLNRRNLGSRPPKRWILLGGGSESALKGFTYLLRALDRWLRTRTSIYGWAFYFGTIHECVDCSTWSNVCVRCGAGHPSDWLRDNAQMSKRFLWARTYRCPDCGGDNLFTDDRFYQSLK